MGVVIDLMLFAEVADVDVDEMLLLFMLSESIDPLLEIFLIKRFVCSKLKMLEFFLRMNGESVKLL